LTAARTKYLTEDYLMIAVTAGAAGAGANRAAKRREVNLFGDIEQVERGDRSGGDAWHIRPGSRDCTLVGLDLHDVLADSR
jgi:hypothetical protein